MKGRLLFSFLSLALVLACDKEADPCSGDSDLSFIELNGKVKYDERFGRNILIEIHTSPPFKIDGTNHYIPCNLTTDFAPGSTVTFTGKGTRIEPPFDMIVGGDAFFTIVLSQVVRID